MPPTHPDVDDRSVAPVVGVVLLVGLVVVLSAVAGVMVLGVGQDAGGPNVRAAVDVDQTGHGMLMSEVRVTAVATDGVDEIVVRPDPSNRACTTRTATLSAAGDAVDISGCAPGDAFVVLAIRDGDALLLQRFTLE